MNDMKEVKNKFLEIAKILKEIEEILERKYDTQVPKDDLSRVCLCEHESLPIDCKFDTRTGNSFYNKVDDECTTENERLNVCLRNQQSNFIKRPRSQNNSKSNYKNIYLNKSNDLPVIEHRDSTYEECCDQLNEIERNYKSRFEAIDKDESRIEISSQSLICKKQCGSEVIEICSPNAHEKFQRKLKHITQNFLSYIDGIHKENQINATCSRELSFTNDYEK